MPIPEEPKNMVIIVGVLGSILGCGIALITDKKNVCCGRKPFRSGRDFGKYRMVRKMCYGKL